MKKRLTNKQILITAGPTWVPIDRVRVITNIFSGRLGYLIAKEAAKRGAKITLLLGPGRLNVGEEKNLKIINYKYFRELYQLMKEHISSRKYDIVIHSAAVADYAPKLFSGKIRSGQSDLALQLKPTIKIVNQIKKWDSNIFLVKFKLEVGIFKEKLIDIARKSMEESSADMIVANEFSEIGAQKHKAYIILPDRKANTIIGKSNIAKKILDYL